MSAFKNEKSKNTTWSKNQNQQFFDDTISLEGRKGGQVKKERQQARQIDHDLRDYTYR